MLSLLLLAAFFPSALGANFWFSFGDSYTQTGFVSNGTLPSAENPLGNPAYPGETIVGGTNWIDVDTTVYNKSLVYTYNFAYPGAVVDAKLVTPYISTVQTLTDQVNDFLTNFGEKPATTPWTSQNALFSIWIGVNDIWNTYNHTGDRSAFSETLLSAEFAFVENDAGARNFLFLNVPPINRTPLLLKQPANDQAAAKSVIEGFDAKLNRHISSFKTSHRKVKTFLWDSYAAFTIILDHPKAFGFVDATSDSEDGDFWGNNFHPSSAAHSIFGKEIGEKTLAGTIW